MNDSITPPKNEQVRSKRPSIDFIMASIGIYSFTFVYKFGLQQSNRYIADPDLYAKALTLAKETSATADAFMRFTNGYLTKNDLALLTQYIKNVAAQELRVPSDMYVLFDDIHGSMSSLRKYATPVTPLPTLPPTVNSLKAYEPKAMRRKSSGYIYLMPSPLGVYKIGLTTNPTQRKRHFTTMLPFDVEFIALIQSDDIKRLERQLHTKFKSKHYKGEWFHLSQEDVNYVVGLSVQAVAA